jgi:pyrroloquinoline quinone biosynthesis protein B
MIIKVLGSAAGGGFPQANCNCRNCAAVRRGEPGFRPRTQSSVAVSADGTFWALLNASPDIRQQIAATPELWPSASDPVRYSPIGAVLLTNGDVDHVAGLLSLREGFEIGLHASQRVHTALAANPIFKVLNERHVFCATLRPGMAEQLPGGMNFKSFVVPGKVPLYLERPGADPNADGQAGDTLGLEITDPDSGASFFYIPACAAVDAALAGRLKGAKLVLFDGTLYTDDEMIVQGLSSKTGSRMGHISMMGVHGSMAALATLGIDRRVFVHINNSNPVLDESSPQRREVERAGWEIGYDGMEIRL